MSNHFVERFHSYYFPIRTQGVFLLSISMNSSNPFRALFFIFGVALILGLTALVLPKDGVGIGEYKLKFMDAKEIVQTNKTEKKDITEIVAKVNIEEEKAPKKIKHKNSSKGNYGAPRVVNYEVNNATVVHLNAAGTKSLHAFFRKITSASNQKKKIHILHFGDSQIEGDRMTGFIRQRMQEKFGGYGPGLVAANNVYSTFSFYQDYSTNFTRYTCFGGPKLANRMYGVQNSAARFTNHSVDSTAEEVEAWIDIGPSWNAHGRAQSYNQVKMFYNACTMPCELKVFQGGNLIHQESLLTDGREHTVNLKFKSKAGRLKFVFRSKLSPNINGFSLEGDYGIQVDNIAMRGSSGTFFGSINKNSFANRLKELNVDMVIMQFGGNTLPSLKNKKEAIRYAKYFKSQLLTLKRMRPDLAIIMIGPSDMCKRMNGEYSTFPLLPFWIDQLKEVAVSVGAGYWDLYEAMGGRNSMPAWVEKDLGRPDHIHFSSKGATIAAQLFYEAFMGEYIKFSESE